MDDGDDTAALARLLRERWSCRAFRPDPVPRPTITRILELAGRTPSDCNTQPWLVIVTSGPGTERFRTALSAHAARAARRPPSSPEPDGLDGLDGLDGMDGLGGPDGLDKPDGPDFPLPVRYPGPYLRRRMECGLQLYGSLGIAMADRAASARQAARNFELFGAPHAAVITTEAELGVYGAVDCGLYLQSFLLAAHSLGLGAVPQVALANHAPFIREHFGLPPTRSVVCGVSFGWPDHDHPVNGFRTSRAAVEDTVRWVE